MLAASFGVPVLFRWASSQVVGLVDAGVAGFSEPANATALRLLGQGLYVVVVVVVVVTAMAMLVAIATQLAQSKPVLAWARLKPDPKRLSPVSGAQKLFSPTGMTNMAKQLVKLVLVSVVAVSVVSHLAGMMSVGTVVPLGALLSTLVPQVLDLVRYVSLVGVVIGVADWWAQRHQIAQQLKMTPREAKEEARQEEGSPEARSGRRRAALRLYKARMTGTVKGADVLVVNPTHFAVGLSYRSGTDQAPRVVARGADEAAARLRAESAVFGVPVVTDAPVARSLYNSCFVGDVVPVELYEAVARLLAQVYLLSDRMAMTSGH
jgi:flagellar biosynthetic protein FlhB